MLLATSISEGVYFSKDSGAAWGKSTIPSYPWNRIACDSTGQYVLVASPYGPLYYSISSGEDFIIPIEAPNKGAFWTSVAVSANGTLVFFNKI